MAKSYYFYAFIPGKMKISLIIVTYNRPDALEVIINSILRQTEILHEVIIADDGSDEKTSEVIIKYQKSFPCKLKHVWHKDKGFRAAKIRNKAIKKSTGDCLFFSDGDLFFHPRFFQDLKRNIEPGIALIGSRVFLKKEATAKILNNHKPENISFFSSKTERNRLNSLRFSFAAKMMPTVHFSEKLRGGLLCALKKEIVAVNGWNEDFEGWGKEDTELVARLWFNDIKLKKLKFAGITYHLWHPHLSRQRIDKNEKLLLECIENKSNWCKNGLIKDEKI